jgi:hypothetical protein
VIFLEKAGRNGRRRATLTAAILASWAAGATVWAASAHAQTTPSTSVTTEAPTTSVAPTTTVAPDTTTEAPTTTVASTTTTAKSTTTSSESTTTTVAAASSSSSTQWGWIVAGVVVVVLLAVLALALVARSRRQAGRSWQATSSGPLDAAHQALGLLPVAGPLTPDPAHWRSVRDSVEHAADGLDRVGASSPTDEGKQAGSRAAEALRGLLFALESDQLLRSAPLAPSADQLAHSDSVCRSRRSDAAAALEVLDRLVKPQPRGG